MSEELKYVGQSTKEWFEPTVKVVTKGVKTKVLSVSGDEVEIMTFQMKKEEDLTISQLKELLK